MSITDQTKEKMQATIEHLKNELKNIRTGRANPGILDNITLEVYGTQMRLKDVASVTTPEPRMLLITPYDAKTVGAIGKAIEKANLNIMPIVDANVVRIKIPPMDDSMRKEMVKLCHKKREECKVSIRNVRRDFNEIVRKQKSDAEITEDIQKKIEKTIQELTDSFCREADDVSEKKEKEIATI